jgi:hypothetical protein
MAMMTPAPVRTKTVAGMAAVGRTIVSLTTVGVATWRAGGWWGPTFSGGIAPAGAASAMQRAAASAQARLTRVAVRRWGRMAASWLVVSGVWGDGGLMSATVAVAGRRAVARGCIAVVYRCATGGWRARITGGALRRSVVPWTWLRRRCEVEFRVLGDLEVRRDGQAIALGAHQQRAVLAVLVLHAGELVPSERLIDDLWGERPPATAAKTLQVYISRLRTTRTRGSRRLLPESVRPSRVPHLMWPPRRCGQ